jgi:hypothetical protein
MKKQFTFFTLLATGMLSAQTIPFVDQTSLLPTTTFHSGNAVAVVDMNGDFKDDIVRAAGNNVMTIEYQQAANATFAETAFPNTFGSPWGMCVGDIDNNGFNDVFYGTGSNARILNADATGSSYATVQVNALTSAGSIFVQGCNFADINNDGYLDMLVCNDVAMPHIYIGDGTDSGWVFNQAVMPLATSPASDNSGNYASIWTDINADGLIDLMITHCRQGVTNAADPRRIDQVFINNGNGTYTQDITNWTNLRDGEQGWSTAWGDVDNDGDMDCFVLNQTVNAKLMINNGSGVFSDSMSSSGIFNPTSWFGENATFHDFDNDGFLDLMLSGDQHYLYKGNGDATFTMVSPNPFNYSGNYIRGHAVGDLNGDGFLDVFATYCDLYNSPSSLNDKVWMNDCPNNGNTNHWIKFNLTGGATTGMSNKNGIGAIVKIYGAWGVQVREVRSGEGYGLQNSFTMHFGLGSQTQVDSAFVYWPSGIVDEIVAAPADQTISLLEGSSPLSTHDAVAQTLELNVYPNPVTDDAVIRLDHFASMGLNNLSVNVYDLNGKVIYSESALQRSIIVLDRSLLSSGMYLVEVTNNNKRVATKKLVVE